MSEPVIRAHVAAQPRGEPLPTLAYSQLRSHLARLVLGVAALWLPAVGTAAEVTDMPGELEGIVGITYGGFQHWGALVEDGETISGRRITRHDMSYRLQFSPVEGVALVIDLAHTPSVRFAYPDAHTMRLDPATGSGSYLVGEPDAQDTSVRGAGLVGVWLGAAVAPFSESYGKGHRATWRIDAAFRTPSPNRNLWTARNGKRGAAPGGSALMLQSAFSADLGVGNPWMQVTWIKENPVRVDVIDEAGTAWAEDLRLQPASTLDLTTGIELVALNNRDTGARFAVDLFLGVGYRAWEDVASGVYLPHVQAPSRSIPVTVGDQLQARAGLAFDYHVNRHFRARTGPDVRLQTPFRPEHVYAVRTRDQNLSVGWMVRLEGIVDGKELQR